MECHDVEWIGNHEDDSFWGMFDDFGDGRLENCAVVVGEVESSLAWFLAGTGSEDHEVGSGQVFVVGGGGDRGFGVEGEAVFEVSFFAFGFFDVARE